MLFSNDSNIAKSINAFMNAPDARDPVAYKIFTWRTPENEFCGSITLAGSRSFKNLEVSQVITFEGLRDRHFRRISVEHIAIDQKEVTLESTDQNTFKLIADDCVFFEGKAIEVNTKNNPSGLNADYGLRKL